MKVNFTKKLLSCILAFMFALNILGTQMSVFAATNPASPVQITIFHTNDMHGRLLDAFNKSTPAALTQIGSDYVAAAKKSVPNSLLIDAGDATQGLPFATLSKGADVINLMNAAGYDGMVLGNHEFDYGKDQTIANAKLANFPVISANTVLNGQLFLNGINGNNGADFIKSVNGIKVGFFGITTQETVYKTNPSNLQGISFEDPVTTSQSEVNKLKSQGAAVIIGIMHIGNDSSSNPTSEDIASKVSGINVIIDGHSHTIENKTVNGTLIAQTGCNSANLGRLDITIGTNGSISSTEALIKGVDATSYTPDSTVKALATKISSSQASLFSTIVGHTSSSLWAGTVDGQSVARLGETNLGDLVADAMTDSAKSQIKGTSYEGTPIVSLENGGGVRDSIPQGDINQGQVTTVLPFGNILSLKEVKPSILYNVLENGVSKIIQDQTTGIISGADGRFPQISGMRFEYNPANPAYSRISRIVLLNSDGSDKQVLDKNDTTTNIVLASNDYEIGGGDGYTMLGSLKNIGEGNSLDVITAQYIAKITQQSGGSFSYPSSQGRINVVSSYTYKPYTATITVKNGTGLAGNTNIMYSIDKGSVTPAITDANGILSISSIPSGPHTINLMSNGTAADVYVNNLIGAVNSTNIIGTLQTPAAATISVLATSDIHGNVLNYDYAAGKAPSKGQGLAKVSTYVNSVRAANPNVMLVDDGDTIQGTPLSYYYDMLDTTSEYPLIKVMGAMKYDTWTLGNHEFNYGLTTLNRIITDAKKQGINVLSANTYNSDNTNFVNPYYIKSFSVNGKTIKVGVLGLTTKCIPNWEDKAHYAGLHFNDLVDEAKIWVPKVKTAGADVVIVTAHSGEESASDTIPENEIKALATNVSGIDAIVAGHVHNVVNDTTLKNPDGKTVPVIEPGKWGNYVSQVDIHIDINGAVLGLNTKNVAMDDSVSEDSSIVSLIQPYQNATLKYIQTKLGTSTGEFKGDGQTTQTTPIMELINKVQKDAAGTQLSIAAPLSSSAYIPSGDITIKDIMSVYVYENYLYGVKMTGKQLKNWMEYSVRYYKQAATAADAIAKDPTLNVPDYNLDQLYGATYDVDLTEPACTVDKTTGQVTAGNRIKNLKVNGVLVKNTDVFTVAINNYRYNGGGGFMKAAGLSSTDSGIVTYDSAKALGDDGQVRSLMNSYIKKYHTISPNCSNNWKLYTTTVIPETPVIPVTPAPVVPAPSAPVSVSNSSPASVLSAVQTALASNTAVPGIDVSSSPVVSKDVFNAIKGQNITLTFTGNNITWTFNGKDITSAATSDIDLSLKTVPSNLQAKELDKIKAVTGKDANIFCFSFNYEGALPGKATIKIFIGKAWANKTVNVCRYYSDKNTYEIVQNNLKVDAAGYLTYTTNHCSDYFVTDNSQITNLPQTGSAIDYNFVIDLGVLCTLLGIVLFITGKNKKDDDHIAA